MPRFFLSSWCSGVQSISLGLNGVVETSPAPGEGLVECTNASFTYTFDTGYNVQLTGLLRVHILLVPNTPPAPTNGTEGAPPTPAHKLKFSYFEFTSKKVTKSLAVTAIKGNRMLYTSPSLEGSSPSGTIGHVSPPGGANVGAMSNVALDGSNASNSSGASTSPTLVNGVPEPVLVVERALMPPDPVNEFGITQCTMRVLEVCSPVHSVPFFN